ncbi:MULTISPECIES: hypothetical protein [unclassified Streptomyces]|uniref:hypothetical protein n=1 Tax=unclassified Streptomyces TaxID=2593676 RepID=UPI0029A8E750|nr:hypothetical protein [Streptomyces sp. DK15]MDX2395270.1 hypothetical protein [Streptomyces sp. DK15]
MTSDKGVVRGPGHRGANAHFIVVPQPPAMPPKWDDPPSTISDADLHRMGSAGSQSDPLLAAVSDAMWEPVKADEPEHRQAQRLADIVAGGDELRERWAEMAGLEEAFKAPTELESIVSRTRRAQLHRSLTRARAARRRYVDELFAVTLALALMLLVLVSAASVLFFVTDSLGSQAFRAVMAFQTAATAVVVGTGAVVAATSPRRRRQRRKPK